MLAELPSSLLVEVLSRLSEPVDIAVVLSTCRLFRELVPTISWHLRLLPPDVETRRSTDAKWQRAAVSMISTRLPLTRKLDLTRSSVLAEDVASILGCLRSLDILVLDNCQKLTSVVIDALAVCVRAGPRALSIQRCFALGSTAAGNLLAAAAVDGSRLHVILLSHLDRIDLPRGSPLIECQEDLAAPATPQVYKPIGSGLRILALHNCAGLGAFELAALGATCPLLELLFLGGSVEALGLSREESICNDTVLAAASAIVDLTNAMKNLQVMELTFFTSHVLHTARERLSREVQLWDFCDSDSLAAALLLRRKQASEEVDLALRAASNCSDVRRRTPLHVAATSKDAHSAACLVEIGAATTGMKDTAGASALFVAAELGHAAVCKVLLDGGADVMAENRAGENPLYIAALKGHCEALEAMLSHCVSRGWSWQNPAHYHYGWTPLMAAAVADRQDVGKVILLCNGGTSAELLNAQNRHGQTALHIASRRASLWFVTNLLAAGASVDLRDEYGDRALDVASRYRHRSVIEILRQCSGGDVPHVANSRRYRPRKSKQKM